MRLRYARFAFALACSFLSASLLMVAWSAENLLWSRNAYAMAQAGSWTGLEAFAAWCVYWFFEIGGRTVLSVSLLVCVVWQFKRAIVFTHTPGEQR